MDNSDLNVNSPQGPKFMDMVSHGTPNSLRPKLPDKSRTLMRSAVTPPPPQPSQRVVSQSAPTQPIQPYSSQSITPKTYISSVDSDREARAHDSSQLDLISHFGSQALANTDNNPGEFKVESIASKLQTMQAPEPATPQPSMSIFEKSLEQASAESQPPLSHKQAGSRKGRHLSIIAASVLTVLLIGGFLAYQNFNKLDLYLASSKAGFQATSPSYKPAGYGLGSISTGSGIVAAVYHSNSDSRSYTISEKSSNWDSNTLLQSYVIGISGQNYQTVKSGGRTIYLYGSRNATWVNGGIWYIITSSNSLSDQQLIQLASST